MPELIRCGCDLVEIRRLENPRDRLLDRLFDPEELALCGGRAESLAAFFAAKEAFAKALGCGLLTTEGIGFKDVGIRKTPQGAPYYVWGDRVNQLVPRLSFPVSQDGANFSGVTCCRLISASLSLSHEAGLAMASALVTLQLPEEEI